MSETWIPKLFLCGNSLGVDTAHPLMNAQTHTPMSVGDGWNSDEYSDTDISKSGLQMPQD